MDISEVIDYSAASDYIRCPRYFYFRHVRNWRMIQAFQLDLVFGSSMHAGMEYGFELLKVDPQAKLDDIIEIACAALQAEWALNGGDEVSDESCFPKSPARGMDILHMSWSRYLEEDRAWNIVGAEVPFEIILAEDLPRYIGRMDAVLSNDRFLKILEHKTAKTFSGIWPVQFESNFQIEGYLTAGSVMTDLSPKVTVNGLCAQNTKVEVTRLPITRRPEALDRFVSDMSRIVRMIKNDMDLYTQEKESPAEILESFPRNCGLSCTAYMRKCEYMDICLARVNPNTWEEPPAGYEFDEWDPRHHAEQKEIRLNEAMKGYIK